MKRRTLIYTTVLTLGMAAAMVDAARAQEEPKPAPEPKPAAEAKAPAVYRLDFVVRELNGGKTLNSRNYTLSAREGEWEKVRVESRIPFKIAENSVRYEEAAIGIDCRVQESERGLLLSTKFQATSFAPGGEATGDSATVVRRQLSLSEDSIVALGKPTIIGKLDDVATNHRFELEVTATKVK